MCLNPLNYVVVVQKNLVVVLNNMWQTVGLISLTNNLICIKLLVNCVKL